MKTRFFFTALLLLAFGSLKAQDTVTTTPRHSDPVRMMPDMSQLPELMRELGVNLQHLSDSVDWKSFEEDMERWGAEMEAWGRKMERWGEGFEGRHDRMYEKHGEPSVKAIQVEGSGDVHICQNRDLFSIESDDQNASHYRMEGDKLFLSGSDDFNVTVQNLEELSLRSSGDVSSKGTLKGRNLFIEVTGSGDVSLYVDYDTICVNMKSSGDVILHGQCNVLFADVTGSGDLMVRQLMVRDSRINATGNGIAITPGSGSVINKRHRDKVQKRTSLLFDPHWNGFEAGLNMLMSPGFKVGVEDCGFLELRPLKSWVFNFNIADVGIAFNHRHTAGLYTGIGLGWNNYSFNNPVCLYKDEGHLEADWIDPEEAIVKKSKLGVLYVQAPLMIEVRPTRSMYIAAGVTGGIRINTWTKIKYEDGDVTKVHGDYYVNPFKLDATLRVGGDDIGFFANYNLLPTFDEAHAPSCHTASLGFSINF